MGLLSSLKDVANLASQVILQPVKTTKAIVKLGVKEASIKAGQEISEKSIKEIIYQGARQAVVYTGAVLTAGTTAGRAGVAVVAKTLAPKTIPQAVATVALTGFAVSGALPTAIKSVYTAGKVTGEVVTGETGITAETISPILKTAGIALGIGAVGAGAGFIVKNILEEKDKLTKEVEDFNIKIPSDSAISKTITPTASVPEAVGVPITATPPKTPETVFMEDKPAIAAIKTPSEAPRQKISQKVRISMTQNTMNKKYINKHSHKRRWLRH